MEAEELKEKMIEWNKSYLEAIIDELRPSGEVLQVGFGLGDAANRIQTYFPKNHVIIENDPQIAKEAKNWAGNKENISVIEGAWQDVLATLGTFDSIFFNDYPLSSSLEMAKRLSPEDAAAIANQANKLLSMLEEQFSQIKVQYSDEEIEDFYQKVGQLYPKEMPKFFQMLKDKGCISETQYEHAFKKYHIEANSIENVLTETDPMLAFLEECLKNHMRKGSRFSSFLSDTTSKYEDSQFFDRIITNPNLDYHEKLVSVQIPNYKFNEALVMVLEKFA